MKRNAESASSAADGKTEEPEKRKPAKRKRATNEAQPDVKVSPEILEHRNRELMVATKRLRKKLRKVKEENSTLERSKENINGCFSTMNRMIEEFIRTAADLLGKSDESLLLEANGTAESTKKNVDDEKVKDGKDFIERLYSVSTRNILLKNAASLVRDVKEDDDDDDDDEDSKSGGDKDCEEQNERASFRRKMEKSLSALPTVVEKQTSKQVNVMLGLLRHISENILGKSNASEEVIKRLLNQGQDATTLRIKARNLETECSLYLDRTESLRSQIRDLHERFEEAVEERDLMQRRLTAVCAKALNPATLVEKMALDVPLPAVSGRGTGGSASSSSSSGIASSSRQDGKDGTDGSKGTSSEELELSNKIAEDRLREIQSHIKEKEKLIEEIESLRATLKPTASSSSHNSGEGGITPDLLDVSMDQSDLNKIRDEYCRIQAELNRSKQECAKFYEISLTAKQSLEQLEKTAIAALAKREDEFISSISERDKAIATYRTKLESARNEIKINSRGEELAAECRTLIEGLELEKSRLAREVERLRDSPTAVELRNKLEALAQKAWPDNTELQDAALLKADLDAAREELRAATADQDSLINEIQQVSEALNIATGQSSQLLKRVEEKDADLKRWGTKVVDLNEELNKLKNQLKITKKEVDEEKHARTASDKQNAAMAEEMEKYRAAVAVAEELSKTANARFFSVGTENESLKKKISDLEAVHAQLQTKVQELEKANKDFRKAKETAMYDKNRADEDRKKIKKKFEKLKSNPVLDQAQMDYRSSMMENALKCPLRSEYWKDAIIIKCCHMFSRKALEDNLAKRNRKCPTCKRTYNKEDIREVYLYQKNDYED